jgi:hypothetical protein
MFRTFAAAALAAIALAPAAAQSGLQAPAKFTAFAINSSNMTARAQTSQVDIRVNRWSSDADRERLIGVLRDKGQQALLHELQKLPVIGYINTPGSLRYDLRFARQIPGDEGGERVVLATDRYMTTWEAMNQPRTVDYPFTVIELQLDRNGQGKGWASLFTKITATPDGNIELENFATAPVLLNDVKLAK